MEKLAKLDDRQDVLASITKLEKELSARTGKDVAVVAYSPVKYASLDNDAEALAKITELEQDIAAKTGKDIVLVAFSV